MKRILLEIPDWPADRPEGEILAEGMRRAEALGCTIRPERRRVQFIDGSVSEITALIIERGLQRAN